MKKQYSLVVEAYFNRKGDWVNKTDELNSALEDGWKFVSATPMGGGPGGESASAMFCSLVIIEKEE
jgi:hypothetical protein